MTVIDNIVSLLHSRGVSQKDLSAATGISTGNISDWKSGRSTPKLDAISKVADYLGVSVDYLLGRTDIPDMTHPPGTHSNLSCEEIQLLNAYRRADDHVRKLVAVALEPFAEASPPPAQSAAAV